MSNEQEMRIMKTGECSSLSGKSTLAYQVGCNTDNEIYIALTGNSGSGIFNKDWFDIEEIFSLLAHRKNPITSDGLHGLLENRSSNSAGFILAALLKEGVLKVSPGNRHYDLVGQAEYKKVVQALIKTVPDEKPTKKKSSKKGKGVS